MLSDNNAAAMRQLESRIADWAGSQPEIRAILVIGSRARREYPADEWSDLDLMVFATNVDPYLANGDWLDAIGEPWLILSHQTGSGHQERMVRLDGFCKVDFVFHTVDELQRMAASGVLSGVYHRGYYVLVDKDGLAAQLPSPPFSPPPYERPAETFFVSLVNWFWNDAIVVACQIRRRNLWVVKLRDWRMKEILLRMLEWHTRAAHGWNHDTWHDGRFLSDWTDPQTWSQLQGAFARFAVPDSWRALLTTMDLFRRAAVTTASHLSYAYPIATDERATELVEQLYAQDTEAQPSPETICPS